jgi:SAM-dependent methyltransferase
MATKVSPDVKALQSEIQAKYAKVARTPNKGFHFHTGRPLADRLGYPKEILDGLPEECIEAFAGVGCPFLLGDIQPGQAVVDVGSGAGFDSLIAGRMVGSIGSVIGVDMTIEMLDKARRNVQLTGMSHVSFREGVVEELPLADHSADVVITNGLINLVPDKKTALKGILRILKPGGRLQLSDIVVHKAVPDSARQSLDLWTD